MPKRTRIYTPALFYTTSSSPFPKKGEEIKNYVQREIHLCALGNISASEIHSMSDDC